MKGNEKNNETLIALTPILSVKNKRYESVDTYATCLVVEFKIKASLDKDNSLVFGAFKLISSRTILIGQEPFQFSPGDLVGLLYSNSSFKPMNETNSSFRTIEVERLETHKLLDTMEILEFKTSKNRYGDNRISDSIGGLVFLVTKVGENRMMAIRVKAWSSNRIRGFGHVEERQRHIGRSGKGLRYCSCKLGCTGDRMGEGSFLAGKEVRVLCSPSGKKGCATWDEGNSTWGGRVRVFGTVSVCLSVQERAGCEGRVLAGRVVKGVLFGS
nr:hypothetical protein [Tanacetum cinerariifolium]